MAITGLGSRAFPRCLCFSPGAPACLAPAAIFPERPYQGPWLGVHFYPQVYVTNIGLSPEVQLAAHSHLHSDVC